MIQKVLKVGSSAAVTIPKKSLEELGIKVGDTIMLEIDQRKKMVSIRPSKKDTNRREKIAELTLDFINRYRSDLKALAEK
jgi:putative addiction module antidote